MATKKRTRKRAASTAAAKPAPTRPAINPDAVRDWSKRIVAVRAELQQTSGDVLLNRTRVSLAAMLEAVQTEMDAAIERAG